MRRLSLHASALNDAEYDLYTTSLNDLAWADDADDHRATGHDDVYYEQMRISVREARGWLRGRYSHVPPANIDAILRFFSPSLSQTDTVSGGQFFAALRLVVHTESGKDLDRSLAFVQAHPTSRSMPGYVSGPEQLPSDLPTPAPMRRLRSNLAPLTPTASTMSSEELGQTKQISSPISASNPSDCPPAPLHPPHQTDTTESQLPHKTHTAHNPFLKRNDQVSHSRPDDTATKIPPLPPRKPVFPTPAQPPSLLVPPPRHNSVVPPLPHRSTSPSRPNSTPTPTPPAVSHPPPPVVSHPPPPPVPPPKASSSHITSTLMKQSLQASKAAQTMKKAEEQLERERVLQVLQSSSIVSGGYSLAGASVTGSSVVIGTNIRNRSSSPTKFVYAPKANTSASHGSGGSDEHPPPVPRRRQQQQPSPPMSVSSLEQVALAAASPAHSHQPPLQPPVSPLAHATRSNVHSYNAFRRPLHDSGISTASMTSQTNSPNTSPSRSAIDLPHNRPPTHPDRRLSHYQYHMPSTFSPPDTSSTIDAYDDVHAPTPPSFEAAYGSVTDTPHLSASAVSAPSGSGSIDSPVSRVSRSKSMHHPSPPPPPVPPLLRRKRPESVQVLGSGELVFGGGRGGPAPATTGMVVAAPPHRAGSGLSRHTSLSAPSPAGHRKASPSISSTPTPLHGPQAPHPHAPVHSEGQHESALTGIQRTLATLQPKLDAVRYKAEAGLSRRGFMRDGGGKGGLEGEEQEGLMGMEGEWNRGRGRGRGVWNSGGGGGDGDEEGKGWEAAYGVPRIHGSPERHDYSESENDNKSGISGVTAGEVDADVDGDEKHVWTRTRDRWADIERDNLKWPAGVGWKPL